MKILIVVTSCNMLPPSHPTGLWLEEFAVAYSLFAKAGVEIVVASPQGGPVPLDPQTTPNEEEKQKWAAALHALSASKLLSEISAQSFDAIYIPGGHGPVVDLTDNQVLHNLITELDRRGKIIAAVCHGPTGLLNAKSATGAFLLKGRKVTGFTNVEENLAKLADNMPFLLEDEMKNRGGIFESSSAPWAPHVVRDGNVITGQNPASSQKIAETILSALNETL